MQNDFVIVNIGRMTEFGPMTKTEWLAFQNDIRNMLARNGQLVGRAAGTSEWDGKKESFVSYHVLIKNTIHGFIRDRLAQYARYYSQDAIAYVISTPDSLVSANAPLNTYL